MYYVFIITIKNTLLILCFRYIHIGFLFQKKKINLFLFEVVKMVLQNNDNFFILEGARF